MKWKSSKFGVSLHKMTSLLNVLCLHFTYILYKKRLRTLKFIRSSGAKGFHAHWSSNSFRSQTTHQGALQVPHCCVSPSDNTFPLLYPHLSVATACCFHADSRSTYLSHDSVLWHILGVNATNQIRRGGGIGWSIILQVCSAKKNKKPSTFHLQQSAAAVCKRSAGD